MLYRIYLNFTQNNNIALFHKFHSLKGILSILDKNLDHKDFVYICIKLKEWRVLYSCAVMFDT